ncbi:enoyl-coa hydratase domain-containing protein 3, mitochondrial [Plakobranchus ocellatus]|uniref:Enoyl-CoA hydratase domain-containing protein 3, mitochondrial n=1 Tax=Plakobranchus ocellatus TaxID=259542 RepID=A0AAV4CCT9_9GAST|nr:enoyl-coa hydratase domain-containing protein 3, mitochondrial [Plakobranchus ocellatus]
MSLINSASRFARAAVRCAKHTDFKDCFLKGQHNSSRITSQLFSTSSVHRVQNVQTEHEPLTLSTEQNGIRTICLNNPKKRNALSLAMLQSLYHDLKRDQKDLRVIILTAKGRVFSAGHDLKELTPETGSDYHEEVFSTCTSVMNLIQDLDVPVIAQINGLATAAGCQLVATCDIAVASASSQFATPGVNVGLFCTTPAVAVGRSVPRKVAMEMLLTGHPISAQDALLHGLVSKVVPDDDVERETMKIAERICETSKRVSALGKATFYAQMALERRNAYRLAERIMVENLTLDDGIEGIEAFIQKRKPIWNRED